MTIQNIPMFHDTPWEEKKTPTQGREFVGLPKTNPLLTYLPPPRPLAYYYW